MTPTLTVGLVRYITNPIVYFNPFQSLLATSPSENSIGPNVSEIIASTLQSQFSTVTLYLPA